MTKEQVLEKHCGYHYEQGTFKNMVLPAMDEYANIREQYWKDRCLAAEDFISATPCDPDITNEQIITGEKWQSLKDQEDKFIEQQNKQQ